MPRGRRHASLLLPRKSHRAASALSTGPGQSRGPCGSAPRAPESWSSPSFLSGSHLSPPGQGPGVLDLGRLSR